MTHIAIDPESRIGIMAGAVAPARETVASGELLQEDILQRLSFDEMRAEITVHREEIIVLFKCVRAPNRRCLIAVTRVRATDNLPLPVQTQYGIVHFTCQPHVLIQLEALLVG